MTDVSPETPEVPVDTDTEKYDEAGNCVLVKWPVAEPPAPGDSVTAGKSRDEIIAWIGSDEFRAIVVLREESDKFEDADVDLLWACHNVIQAARA